MVTLLVGDEFMVRGDVITGPISRRLTASRRHLQTLSPSVRNAVAHRPRGRPALAPHARRSNLWCSALWGSLECAAIQGLACVVGKQPAAPILESIQGMLHYADVAHRGDRVRLHLFFRGHSPSGQSCGREARIVRNDVPRGLDQEHWRRDHWNQRHHQRSQDYGKHHGRIRRRKAPSKISGQSLYFEAGRSERNDGS